jgi:hypothetical protein
VGRKGRANGVIVGVRAHHTEWAGCSRRGARRRARLGCRLSAVLLPCAAPTSPARLCGAFTALVLLRSRPAGQPCPGQGADGVRAVAQRGVVAARAQRLSRASERAAFVALGGGRRCSGRKGEERVERARVHLGNVVFQALHRRAALNTASAARFARETLRDGSARAGTGPFHKLLIARVSARHERHRHVGPRRAEGIQPRLTPQARGPQVGVARCQREAAGR